MKQETPRRSPGPFLAALMLVAYLPAAATTSLYMMLGAIATQFDNPLRVGWTVSAYFLVGAAGAAICGRLGDLLGRRRIVMTSIAFGTAGALCAVLSPNLNAIILSCALLGMLFTLTPLAIGIVRDGMPADKIPFSIALIATVGQVGSGLNFLFAGMVLERFGIRGVFVMLFLFGLTSLAALLAFVPRDPAHKNSLKDIRLASGILFAPAIAGIFIALELGRRLGWGDQRTLGMLALSLVVLAFWSANQWRQENPLINVRSLVSRQVGLANLMTMLMCMGTMSYGVIGPVYLSQPESTGAGFGINPTTAGTLLLAIGMIGLLGGPWSGHLITRHGGRFVSLAGMAAILAGWLALLFGPHTLWFFVTCMAATQLGLSLSLPAIYALIIEATPAERTSEAIGLNLVFLSTFLAVGAQITILILSSSTLTVAGSAVSYYSAEGFRMAFYFIVAISALTQVAAWALPRRQ